MSGSKRYGSLSLEEEAVSELLELFKSLEDEIAASEDDEDDEDETALELLDKAAFSKKSSLQCRHSKSAEQDKNNAAQNMSEKNFIVRIILQLP